MVFSHPAVEALTWWDFSDRGAWQGAPAGFVRKDMSPKPAYEVLQRLVKDKWWTKTTATTDAGGVARFRGILGDYRLTVAAAGRPQVTRTVALVKNGENKFVIQLAVPETKKK
jgi:hypothetical protein